MKAWLLIEHDDLTRRLITLEDVSSVTARAEAPNEDSVDAYGRLSSITTYDRKPTGTGGVYVIPEIRLRVIQDRQTEQQVDGE